MENELDDHSLDRLQRRILENMSTAIVVLDQNLDVLKFSLEFITLSTRDQEIREAVTQVYKNRVNIFAKILTEGVEAGSFKRLDARSVAHTLYFLSMGFFLTYFTVNIDFDLKKQHSINMQTILNGINNRQ